MSMKWIGGPNYILQLVPSEKPTQYPTTQLTLAEWWYGMVLHPYSHPPHIKHAKHLLYYVWIQSGMSMKWMGGPNHILQHVPSEKPTENPTTVGPPTKYWVRWVCWSSLLAAIPEWTVPNFHKAFTQLHLDQLSAFIECTSGDRRDGGIDKNTEDIVRNSAPPVPV